MIFVFMRKHICKPLISNVNNITIFKKTSAFQIEFEVYLKVEEAKL